MNRITIKLGTKVRYQGASSIIVKIIDVDTISIEEIETNIVHTIPVNLVSPDNIEPLSSELLILPEIKWELAKKRYEVIKPILENKRGKNIVKTISDIHKISPATIYRWMKSYKLSGQISSLAGTVIRSSKGGSKLDNQKDLIINSKIESEYLSKQRKSIPKTIREIQLECDQKKISPPHPNTIRNRIKNLSEEEKIRRRYSEKDAREKFEPIRSNFDLAEFPLSIIQIDHTPVDIILVDEHTRNPYQRPWLTLAIDLYSRAVVGFYLSYDHPSAYSVGACIANSILPKEMWLERLGVNSKWPCWGLMDNIHVDNAKEFHSKTLKNACLNYGVNLMYRPVATPHYGGHIERLLGTFSREIHNLPGTTFSSEAERKGYDSEKKASLTLTEFEKWLTIYITKIYHNKIHTSISTTPIDKFREGLLGSNSNIGKGIPQRIFDERRVRLDFMPYIERTIQEYGIVNDHIYYYNDVLRPYINSKDSKGNKIKYIFRIDPRDISSIFFYDPKNSDYYEIPYRNTSFPPISIWEYRDIVKKLRISKKDIDENSIFQAYRELNELEHSSIKKTQKRKKENKNQYYNNVKDSKHIETDISITINNIYSDISQVQRNHSNSPELNNVQPFDDIEF